MPKVSFKLDLQSDAWNWWNGCNTKSHGVDWKKGVSPALQRRVAGKREHEAYRFIKPYLRRYYADHKQDLQRSISIARREFRAKMPRAFKVMERVTGKPIYRDTFTCFMTTFPRCPYNPRYGYVWICATWPPEMYVQIFLHELLHFQFIHYWREADSEIKQLSRDKFEFLKEAMTVILDDEFKEFMHQPDKGYEIHKHLRVKLRWYWRRYHNFDALIRYGTKLVHQYAK